MADFRGNVQIRKKKKKKKNGWMALHWGTVPTKMGGE